MATATRKKRVARKTPVAIKAVEAPVVEAPVEKCFYCRESKYEPSATRCPVSSHTSLRGGL